MTFGVMNFHVNDAGTIVLPETIRQVAPVRPAPAVDIVTIAPSPPSPASPAVDVASALLASSSVGSSDVRAPPPSPTTAYCLSGNTYHYVGLGDFRSTEICRCDEAFETFALHRSGATRPTAHDGNYAASVDSSY